MPIEWWIILSQEKPKASFLELKRDMTVADVYDLLEIIELDKLQNHEMERIKDANR